MKTILTLTAIALLAATEVKAQYHIRVDKDKYIDIYTISFTNNNWKTSDKIKSFSGTGYGPHQFLIGSDRWEEAVRVAKKFTTYQKCIAYNKDQLRLFRSWRLKQDKNRNKTFQIY